MKVKEVVLTAAGLLGMKKEMEEYLSSTASSAKKKVDEFVDCFNLVENELALDYVPLRTKETFLAQDGVVEFRYFTREPARVLSVTDEMDRRVEYALFPTDIRLPAGVKTAKVAYAFLPKKRSSTHLSVTDASSTAQLNIPSFSAVLRSARAQLSATVSSCKTPWLARIPTLIAWSRTKTFL